MTVTANSIRAQDKAPRATDATCAPFLRWAGGKRWLLPTIHELAKGTPISRYHEPFVGGGSVFLGLNPGPSSLSDLNSELIEVYSEVKRRPDQIAQLLEGKENTEAYYYQERETEPDTATERAARFIYLNHTSYNGIFRVNLNGKYNVPYGRRKSINIPNQKSLRLVSKRLNNCSLLARDFEEAINEAKVGDLVFLDPPYTVAHNHNGFVKYNQHLFGWADQKRLASCIDRLLLRGANFILTNAAHESIEALFSPLGNRFTINRKNAIGGRSASRGRADEYLFTNLATN
ncbi:DNA adenine methylase [Nesterenkonia haasae]|uniref:DNA adenine methylase n=1 Tax=Nesterenkonia haasae TaxID=2587813 RepID=UPI00139123E9|nr:Dam family site-specific DNA-(adenine-N6)-methyltransferase [Nesterenkonia haasae]NDK32790.1 Dam family site-specific DNA-(adenine-N6)-methyltransferase [Nesterenkonia haasae]